MLLSKLKEALICLKAGRVTLPYPFKPAPAVAPGFRGKLTIKIERCIGCAGCANVCPPRAIKVTDMNKEKRIIEFFLERCTYCARCEEVCPEKAIEMSNEFETSTNDIQDMHIRIELEMNTCQRCGRCFIPANPLDKMMITGFREEEQ